MGRNVAKKNHVDAALVDEVEGAVRKAKSLPLGKLPFSKLTEAAQAELERKLVQRGLERHDKGVRVPIEAQLRALLQVGAHVPFNGITNHVKGALKDDIVGAVSRLVHKKQARVIFRGDAEVAVSMEERVLGHAEVAKLNKLVARLTGMLKRISATSEPRTLLRDDIAELFDGLQDRKPERPAPRAPAAGAQRHLVEVALRRLEDPKLKIVRIPELVRSLHGELSMDEVHLALSEAADGGAIELHPDAGSEFLPMEDARLCPPGPRNTVFSYARLLSP